MLCPKGEVKSVISQPRCGDRAVFYSIFERTSEIQRLIISLAISGVHVR
jgi:hypothetical protein